MSKDLSARYYKKTKKDFKKKKKRKEKNKQTNKNLGERYKIFLRKR